MDNLRLEQYVEMLFKKLLHISNIWLTILIYLQKDKALLFIITKKATIFIIEYDKPLTSKTFRSIETYF